MAYDLSATPETGIRVQACGDAHISNFGVFASPERQLVFDVNDFDETLRPVGMGREAAGRQHRDRRARQRVLATRSARACVRRVAAELPDRDGVVRRDARSRRVVLAARDPGRLAARPQEPRQAATPRWRQSIVDKARTKDSMQAFARLTKMVDGQRRIASDPPLIVSMDELLPAADAEQFRGVAALAGPDVSAEPARRSPASAGRLPVRRRRAQGGGVGSVGTRAYILLFVGRDDDDPLFLQAKEAQTSVLAPLRRQVARTRTRASASSKASACCRRPATSSSGGIASPARMASCATSTSANSATGRARGRPRSWTRRRCSSSAARRRGRSRERHARSGDRIAIASYLGKSDTFDRAIATFAEAYADQNQRDYEALQAAAADGRIQVEAGL